ncbi:NAD(P)/FAD-dependent oxidoreductase [Novosphingobium sp. TH158]|uniref:NAD(P)/FAD-dependent oxidoreductase n=1 Tax=Novosphingobium sp. TH158 TaxID=2067455 RepID=UPI000C7DD3E9|nr:FAD-dependent oxidoreductase [Novosphingobium sp. TH158]PLK25724.1 NAD/FAD-dependent oxidoreductase [Novosphingobium sp. TH158]
MKIAIIGAGMAGLSCAGGLAEAGHEVILFDKGRGPGGRMSTRRMATPLGDMRFDHGAQYFTAKDPAFRAQVDLWTDRGVVALWPAVEHEAWVGVPAMNAVIKDMAERHDVRWNVHVDRVEKAGDRWLVRAGDASFAGFDVVVLAVPAEQALPFLSLHDFDMARQAMLARSQPCWTGMFSFAEPLATAEQIVRDRGFVAWAARSASKPGREAAEGWVVQANPLWSANHIEDDKDSVAQALLRGLGTALGLAGLHPVTATAHRWRYAMSAGLGIGSMWNPRARIGACGDWLIGPRVECAWLSGRDIARKIGADQAALQSDPC